MTGPGNDLTIERFMSLLDAYGGDLARWPSQHASAAESLLRQSAEARLRLAETQALDRLLDTTPAFDAARMALLADRIVTTAAAERLARARSVVAAPGKGARVIRLPRAAARPGPAVALPARTPVARPAATSWRPVAALAASLLLGVAIGLTDIAQTTTLGIASLTETAMSEAEVVISAVQLDTLNALDEDQI